MELRMGMHLSRRQELSLRQRLQQRPELRLIRTSEDRYRGLKGTPENVDMIANRIEKEGMTAILWGGCAWRNILRGKLARKDIDCIVIDGSPSKFQWEVDWWIRNEGGCTNGNGVTLNFHIEGFDFKGQKGLFLLPGLVEMFYGVSTEFKYKNVKVGHGEAFVDIMSAGNWVKTGGVYVLQLGEDRESPKLLPLEEQTLGKHTGEVFQSTDNFYLNLGNKPVGKEYLGQWYNGILTDPNSGVGTQLNLLVKSGERVKVDV